MSNTAKAYHSFTDVHGNAYGFADYMSFATWFFDLPRRIAVVRFSPETFKKLNRAAVSSKEARQPVLTA